MSTLVKDAESFAKIAHHGQAYGDHPYDCHLQTVVQILDMWGFHENKNDYSDHVLAVGWLHDVIEDTETMYGDLSSRFGADVAMAVHLVTDPLGLNREEKKKKLYRQFISAPQDAKHKSWAALAKCADRYANQRSTLLEKNQKRLKMYASEFPTFMATFGHHTYHLHDGVHNDIWDDLFKQYIQMIKAIE